MALGEGKVPVRMSSLTSQVAPLCACQPCQRERPPRTVCPARRGLPACVGVSAGAADRSARRSRLGLRISSRSITPATGPTHNGSGPGVVRPKRARWKRSPLTFIVMASPDQATHTSYQVSAFTTGPRSRDSHFPSI